ncbi:MAG: alpha/beta hydrolase [Acidimicrobiia bacterium]|nr:alpha/beta hydrolase [Acidimicrobiia bacterium]MDH3462454.1 alpha/beta hydrolase [Acidimicrobiia bacterium]
MDIVLIAGLWLEKSIWNEVCVELERLGHNPIPVALPGVDDGAAGATLEDQVAAVLDAIDQAERPVVVGHSAACGLAWIAADQRPDAVEKVALIGGFAPAAGEKYADFFEIADGLMGFPGWEPFEGPDSADLDEATKARISANAVPVPARVARGVVALANERRYDVPIFIICPEFSPDQAQAWIGAGDVPELAKARDLEFIDIDSGHWPMVSQPVKLAEIMDGIAKG